MSNLALAIGLPIGILGFLFLFWKRLKEDYISEQIFSVGFLISLFLVIGFFAGLFIANTYKLDNNLFKTSGSWFWVAAVLTSLSFALTVYKFKLRLFESIEAASLGFIFFVFTIFLINSILNKNIGIALLALITGLLFPLYYLLNKKYKTFSWYKSGKTGFSGLFILGLFFTIRVIVALINPSMLSFIGKVDAIISTFASFVIFISLYNLSQV